jgi:hypothetical protein
VDPEDGPDRTTGQLADVRIIARRSLPLDHPDVVVEVVRVLLELDDGEHTAPRTPAMPSLLGDAATALRESVAGLLDRVRKA